MLFHRGLLDCWGVTYGAWGSAPPSNSFCGSLGNGKVPRDAVALLLPAGIGDLGGMDVVVPAPLHSPAAGNPVDVQFIPLELRFE